MLVMIGVEGEQRCVKGGVSTVVTNQIKEAKIRRNQAVQIMATATDGGESLKGGWLCVWYRACQKRDFMILLSLLLSHLSVLQLQEYLWSCLSLLRKGKGMDQVQMEHQGLDYFRCPQYQHLPLTPAGQCFSIFSLSPCECCYKRSLILNPSLCICGTYQFLYGTQSPLFYGPICNYIKL